MDEELTIYVKRLFRICYTLSFPFITGTELYPTVSTQTPHHGWVGRFPDHKPHVPVYSHGEVAYLHALGQVVWRVQVRGAP